MDATTIRRAACVALLTFTMPLPEFTPLALAQSDASRLDALRDAVQTEIRYVEGEEFVGDRTLLAALDELRDEVGYLRVSLKRGLPVPEAEFRRVEERLAVVREGVRRADANTERSAVVDALEVPVGATLELRLRDSLSSAIEAGVAHRFYGTTVADVRAGGQVVIPAGSIVAGTATLALQDGRPALVVALREISVSDRTYVVQLRLTGLAGADDPSTVEFHDDHAVVIADDRSIAVPAGATLQARFEAPVELTAR
jgi:hypothetical protein